MKVLQVVTAVTPDGSYGGPLRVAVNQSTALRDAGHDVTIAASTFGFDSPPTQIYGVTAELFPLRRVVPGLGWAGVASPAMMRWFSRAARRFDVVHIHLARDLVTLPIARTVRRKHIPYVVQPHGMIDRTDRLLATPLDTVLTRPALRGAAAVFCLTDAEESELSAVAGHLPSLMHLRNGVPPAAPRNTSRVGTPEVLFLARLQRRKRPLIFVEAARRVLENGFDARFTLVGPDEGEGAAVRAAIEASGRTKSIVWEGSVAPDQAIDRLAGASLLVLPSRDEPFPMAVLEAMSAGVPSVVTTSCGLAPLISRTGSGLVVDESVSSLVYAIESVLSDPDALHRMGTSAYAVARTELGMDAVVKSLQSVYRAAITGRV
ncbi:glycosyltransferase [Actinomycetes bacterium M1A6_2h]